MQGEREVRSPFSAFTSACLVFLSFWWKKSSFIEVKRACSTAEEERDSRLPTTPGALGGSCRLTMHQSVGASQETRYRLPDETQNYVKSWGARRVLAVCIIQGGWLTWGWAVRRFQWTYVWSRYKHVKLLLSLFHIKLHWEKNADSIKVYITDCH